MAHLIIMLDNRTNLNITIGAPTHLVGVVTTALGPDPLVGGAAAVGMLAADGQGDLVVNYMPVVASPVHPA